MAIYEAIKDSQYKGRYRFKGKWYRFKEEPPKHIFRKVVGMTQTREEVARDLAQEGQEVPVPETPITTPEGGEVPIPEASEVIEETGETTMMTPVMEPVVDDAQRSSKQKK